MFKKANNDSLKWDELNAEEKNRLDEKINYAKNIYLQMVHAYDLIIYKCYFILNGGGLAGIITLLTIEEKNKNVCSFWFYVLLILIFFLGIASIIFSTKLERKKFEKDYDNTFEEFEKYKQNKICRSDFINKINSENCECDWAKIFEWASFGFFIFGVIVGIIFLFLKV